MLLTQRVSAVIHDISPERIWDFSSDRQNWTASNPVEHRGLERFSKNGLPETGAMFHQQEYVAGVFEDIRGHFLYVDRPRVCVWTGIAKYRLLGGLLETRIAEGGTATLTSAGNGWELAHDVFMDYSKLDQAGGLFCHPSEGKRRLREVPQRRGVIRDEVVFSISWPRRAGVPTSGVSSFTMRSAIACWYFYPITWNRLRLPLPSCTRSAGRSNYFPGP